MNLLEQHACFMVKVPLLVLSFIAISGCTVTRPIDLTADQRSQNHVFGIKEFNDEIKNESILVRLNDNREIRAENGNLSQKYFEFQSGRNDKRTQIDIDSISEISYKDHLGGVLDAAFISILPAIIAGIRYDVGGADHDPAYSSSIAVYGAGLLLGFAIEKKHVFEILPDSLKHREN